MKKEFLLLLFMTAVNVGSFQLPSPFIYGADLLNGVMMIFCFKRWEKLRSPYNSIFVTWILLAIYIGFLAITSDYVEGASSLMESLRELYPFGLLIYIVFLLSSQYHKTFHRPFLPANLSLRSQQVYL